LGEAPSETVLDDQGAPKPLSVRLDVLLDPLFASGSERAEEENCALIANQYVRVFGTTCDELLMDACSFRRTHIR